MENWISVTIKCLILAAILRYLIVWSYRILLHPFHKYPGPFIAKLTEWYGAYHALRLHWHLVTYKNHELYGDVVRCAPNKLVFNTVEAQQEIYNNPRLTKARSYLTIQVTRYYNVFTALDNKLHSHKRKIVGKALSDRSLREFEPVMLRNIDVLMDELKESSEREGTTNLTTYLKRFGFDVVTDLAFGESLHLQTDAKNRWVIPWLAVFERRNNSQIQAPTFKWSGIGIPITLLRLARGANFLGMIRGLIEKRTQRGRHAREDIFAFVLDSRDPFTGEGTSMMEFLEEALFFFPAGGGTISAALCALLFYLSRHPSCYQRVASEVRTTFATDADIRSGPKLARCKYLRACFDEALRLSPPVGGTLWRELPANDTKSLTIQGHVIPKGTQVGVSIYSIHHNAKYFPDPFSFRPERWLQGDEEGVKLRTEGMYNAFTPFSSGPRGCEGKAMAYTEAGLVVAKLLMRFDFDRCNKDGYTDVGGGTGVPRELRGRREEFQMYDHFSASHDGPCLVLRARTR